MRATSEDSAEGATETRGGAAGSVARALFQAAALAAGTLACATAPAPVPSVAPEAGGYLAELVALAREQELARSPQWRALLHYHDRSLGRGVDSFAESEQFFRAAHGHRDPEAELEATLKSFLEPEEFVREGEPGYCAYPARFHWLDGELGFDRSRMPVPDCPSYEAWRRNVGPTQAASLVFADSFMNNPSSMFGHTLIRFDPGAAEPAGERRDLLAYAVNFAADTGRDDGVLYAMKGIAGSYPAYFSLLPYYDKVRQYSDWESRDIWEYPLALTSEQVEFLIKHLWELQGVAFPYYYFSQNCSYHLLGLLEVARPDLELRGSRPYTIPADSVKQVLVEVGLAGEPTFRPSASTSLRHQATELSAEQRALARDLARGRATPTDARLETLPDPERAAVLSLAYDYLAQTTSTSKKPEMRGRALSLLTARSRVPVRGDPGGSPPVPEVRPDQGHGSLRVRSGVGVRDDLMFLELGLRPAFHDLLDPLGGYLDGAEIALLETSLRYYPKDDEVTLHRLRLIDIVSAAQRDDMFSPISWTFATGIESHLVPRDDADEDLRNALLFRTRSGGGVSYLLGERISVDGFVEGTFEAGRTLQPGYAFGTTGRASLRTGDVEDRWAARLYTEVTPFFVGDTRTAVVLGLDQRLRLGPGLALELKITGERDFGETWLDAGLFLRVYY